MRRDYLSWDEYFMGVALLSAQRSKDENTQVGACIVNDDNKILSVGYNGMPIGCKDEEMPWGAMMKFVHCNPESTNTDTFKLGAKIALLSALVFAVITVADQLYIFPEYYQTIYSAALEEYAKILPAEQVKEIKDMLVQAPKISFFGTFLYCAAYGTVLSFILSRNIPSRNPFNNDKPQEQ